MITPQQAKNITDNFKKETVPSFIFNEIEYAAKKGKDIIHVDEKEIKKLGKDPLIVANGLRSLGYNVFINYDKFLCWGKNTLEISF